MLSSVLIEDDVVEQRESFILRLEVLNQDGISVQLIQDQAVITITDADGKEVCIIAHHLHEDSVCY